MGGEKVTIEIVSPAAEYALLNPTFGVTIPSKILSIESEDWSLVPVAKSLHTWELSAGPSMSIRPFMVMEEIDQYVSSTYKDSNVPMAPRSTVCQVSCDKSGFKMYSWTMSLPLILMSPTATWLLMLGTQIRILKLLTSSIVYVQVAAFPVAPWRKLSSAPSNNLLNGSLPDQPLLYLLPPLLCVVRDEVSRRFLVANACKDLAAIKRSPLAFKELAKDGRF